VAQNAGTHLTRNLIELLGPALGVGGRDVELADHAVEQQVEQLVLARDVAVESGGAGVGLRPGPAPMRTEPANTWL
jgi:hypothetical protein